MRCLDISGGELVFGLPHARIINAAFTHATPLGGRFNGPDRGAWYAGFEIETSQAEIAFHRTVHLAEVGIFEDQVSYVDYLADFRGRFHELRKVVTHVRTGDHYQFTWSGQPQPAITRIR
jgi:hypothetical protein